MNNYYEEPRDDRMEFRLPKALKQATLTYCQANHTTVAALLITFLIEKLSGHSYINYLEYQNKLNRIYNLTLAFPNLDPKYKELLYKELTTNEK